MLITKYISQYKNNCHTTPCSLGNRILPRTKHAAGASRLLIIVRYVLQQEGGLQGVVLHGAGIRNGSAPGCLPNPSENLTFPGAAKGCFSPACSTPVRTSACRRKCFCLLSSLSSHYHCILMKWGHQAGHPACPCCNGFCFMPGRIRKGHQPVSKCLIKKLFQLAP